MQHARLFMISLALLAGPALWVPPGYAQTAEQIAAFDEVLDKSLQEQTVFLNCSALDGPTEQNVQEGNWRQDRDTTLAILQGASAATAVTEDFLARTDPEAILLKDWKFSDIIATCKETPDWREKFQNLEFTLLFSEATKIFGHK